MMILSVFSLHSGPEEPRIVTRIVSNVNVKSRRLKLGEKERKKEKIKKQTNCSLGL